MLEFVILHALAVGVSLFGVLMMWRHRSQWQKQQADPQIEVGEKRFLHGRYRLRMQSSALTAILGLMLNASNEHLVNWQQPGPFFVYVCVMLGLAIWIIILAFAEFMAAQVVQRSALARLREHQRQLEQSIVEMRQNKQP
ncbi:MAG: hypothetical protein JWN70_6114 [Planctomycetaceae bacterium]|nr:hypothetical protein [Planctomycetaceae bacterium]